MNNATMTTDSRTLATSRESPLAASVGGGLRFEVWFLASAGVILAVVGLAKALGATGPARALDVPDPLLGLRFRQLLLLVGQVEILIAFFCLFTDKRRFSLLAVAWISTNFLVYRLGLWLIGWHQLCGCMGSLAGVLHLSDKAADNIMKGVLACLLAGSYLLLLSQWRRARRPAVPPACEKIPEVVS